MQAARVYSCPSCGAPVAGEDRHCGFCRAPVATVRCARCYAMNSPDAVHCSGCGLGLGLMPIGATDVLSCPQCKIELESFGGGPGMLRDCGKCGGQFVDHALLRELIERREIYGDVAPRRIAKGNPFLQPVQYRGCPVCGDMMHRRNFGRSSGIIVDQCSVHGTWFDSGELPRVLAFVEAGGVAEARRRELEDLERRRASASAIQVDVHRLPGSEHFSLLNADYRASLLEDAAEVVHILLDAVATLISRKPK